MIDRRAFVLALGATAASTLFGAAQAQESRPGFWRKPKPGETIEQLPEENPSAAGASREAPSAETIRRRLETGNGVKALPPRERVTIQEIKRQPELRRRAPSIDIQAINFAFGSAEIPYSQYRKVEQIALALRPIVLSRRVERILIEGHTDAVGSRYSNQILSERRAASLKRVLVREFGLPGYTLETVGYGEDFLLVPVPYEEWRNRRVTIRRITGFVR